MLITWTISFQSILVFRNVVHPSGEWQQATINAGYAQLGRDVQVVASCRPVCRQRKNVSLSQICMFL